VWRAGGLPVTRARRALYYTGDGTWCSGAAPNEGVGPDVWALVISIIILPLSFNILHFRNFKIN
jgi:hypothetical protein